MLLPSCVPQPFLLWENLTWDPTRPCDSSSPWPLRAARCQEALRAPGRKGPALNTSLRLAHAHSPDTWRQEPSTCGLRNHQQANPETGFFPFSLTNKDRTRGEARVALPGHGCLVVTQGCLPASEARNVSRGPAVRRTPSAQDSGSQTSDLVHWLSLNSQHAEDGPEGSRGREPRGTRRASLAGPLRPTLPCPQQHLVRARHLALQNIFAREEAKDS